MSRGVNEVTLVGYLGSDPEARRTGSGSGVCNLSVATHDRRLTASGREPVETTEWHRVVVWGDEASRRAALLKKGEQVYVEGRLRTREWTDKDGRRRWTTEVHARSVFSVSGEKNGGST